MYNSNVFKLVNYLNPNCVVFEVYVVLGHRRVLLIGNVLLRDTFLFTIICTLTTQKATAIFK